MDEKENVIEWVNGGKIATLTLNQKKYINRIRKLEIEDKNVEIIGENEDGSIVAHVPVEYIKIIPPRKISEAQKEQMRERIAKVRSDKHV